MIYCTINSKKLKNILIFILAAAAVGAIFCLWAVSARESREQPEAEDVVSASESLIEAVSLADASSGAASSGASAEHPEEPAVPAYVSLNTFTLSTDVFPPLESAVITSAFGFRDHPINGEYSFHSGVDLAAAQGADIFAMLDGTVTTAQYSDSYGNYIIIDHGDDIQTLYAHCSTLCVGQGEAVVRGQKIAEVGATGRATGPHLHAEVRYKGQRCDPSCLLGDNYS